MKKLFFLLILYSAFFILKSPCFSQNEFPLNEGSLKIDSLLQLVNITKEACPKPCKKDSIKVITLIRLCNEYRKIGDYGNGLNYGIEALNLANSIPNEEGRGGASSAYNNIGNVYYNLGNYPAALNNYLASLQINKELLEQAKRNGNQDVTMNKKDLAGSFFNIGIIYYYQKNYPEALKNYFAALNISEEIGDKKGMAISYGNIGLVYDKPGNYDEAVKNFFASLKLFEEIADKKNMVATYNNIGRSYNDLGNYAEALKMYSASLRINEDSGDKVGMALSFTNIGNIYWNEVHYPETLQNEEPSKMRTPVKSKKLLKNAFENYLAALKVRREIGDKQNLAESFFNLGNVQFDLNNYKEAQNWLNKALKSSIETGSKEWIKESYNLQVDLDSALGNWKAAYQHRKLFILYRDSISDEEAKNISLQSAMNIDFEKKEAEFKAKQDIKDAVIATNNNKRQQALILMSCIFILIFVFAVYVLRSNRKIKNLLADEKNKFMNEKTKSK